MATGSLRALGAVAGVLLVLTPRVAAPQDRLLILADEPGKWKPWTFSGLSAGDLRRAGAGAADAKTLAARIKQLADILRASPVWNQPKGVDALLSGSASVPMPPKLDPPVSPPLAGDILMGSFEHLARESNPNDRFVGGETNLVQIGLNVLPSVGGGSGYVPLSDDEGQFKKQPVQTGEMGGFPVYGGDVLVIATNGRSPWAPVSRERYLKAFIAKRRGDAAIAEADIAEQQKRLEAFLAPEAAAARQKKYAEAVAKFAAKGAAAMEHERRYWERDEADALSALKKGASRDPKVSRRAATIAGLKAAEDQLAAMPAAERLQQACYAATDDEMKNGLVAMGSSGCAPVVTENWRFFDAALPRGVVQIIIVSRLADVEKGWQDGRPAAGATSGSIDSWTTYEVLRQTDWRGVAAMLGK